MEALSSALKYPLHFSTHQLLGDCLLGNSESPWISGSQRVAEVALAAFFAITAVVSLPFWTIGELVEVLTPNKAPFFDDTVPLPATPEDELALDPTKTQQVGFSISTYQYTSNPRFCQGSNWERYNLRHFTGDKAHLSVGQGVDILTPDGCAQICDAVLEAHGNALRFSVEIADVMDIEGHINEVALERYVRAAAYLKQRGVTPIVTLSHFVHLLDRNGADIFESDASIALFTKFAAACYKQLKDHVDTFVTFNEANISSVCNNVMGDFPAGRIARFWTHTRVLRHMLGAHTSVYHELHRLAAEDQKFIKVGLTHQALKMCTDSRWNVIARVVCFVMDYLFHESFMKWAENHSHEIDELGIQYYTRPLASGFPPRSTARPDQRMVSSMGFRFYPEGIYPILIEASRRIPGVNLMVTETGTAGRSYVAPGPDDTLASTQMDAGRREYYTTSIKAVRKAQDEGVPVHTFMAWSLFPNFEWPHGFSSDHDFGVIARDAQTKAVRATAAFELLRGVFARSVNRERVAQTA